MKPEKTSFITARAAQFDVTLSQPFDGSQGTIVFRTLTLAQRFEYGAGEFGAVL